jgi:hypothetical protein
MSRPNGAALRDVAVFAYMMGALSDGARMQGEEEFGAPITTKEWEQIAERLPVFFTTLGVRFTEALGGEIGKAEWEQVEAEKKE